MLNDWNIEMLKVLLAIAVTLPVAIPRFASSSYYPARLDDAKAVYLTHDRFPVYADGLAGASDVIQQAINKVQETTNQGILFIPAGRYRLSKTISVWPGIRLIGFGATRPVFVLGAHAPAFQQGPAYMIFFAGFRPGSVSTSNGTGRWFPPADATPPDANPGPFYSAISTLYAVQTRNQGRR